MKLLLLIPLFCLSFQALANDKFICSSYYLYKHRDLVAEREYDKVKHCTYSCVLALKCGKIESYSVGFIKEIADLFGMGEPDFQDLIANKRGIQMAKDLRHMGQCLPGCKKLYPR